MLKRVDMSTKCVQKSSCFVIWIATTKYAYDMHLLTIFDKMQQYCGIDISKLSGYLILFLKVAIVYHLEVFTNE